MTYHHNLTSTWNNYKNGVYKYSNALFSSFDMSGNNQTYISKLYNITMPSYDFSDMSLLGLYRNNLEPQPLKDIQQIIGTEATYSYIAWQTLTNCFYIKINDYLSAKTTDAWTEVNNALGNIAHDYTITLFNTQQILVWNYAPKIIGHFSSLTLENLIHGLRHQDKISSLINAKIHSDEFLALHLSDNTKQEYSILDSNIKSILDAYSNTAEQLLVAGMFANWAYKKYNFIQNNQYFQYNMISSISFSLLSIAYNYLTIDALSKIEKENGYKEYSSSSNINYDSYKAKETILVAGTKHLGARKIHNNKQTINIQEENLPFITLNKLLDGEAMKEYLSLFFGLKHCETILKREDILEDTISNRNKIWGDFKKENKYFNSKMSKLLSAVTPNTYFSLAATNIRKVVKEMEDYFTTKDKNSNSYQHNNSSKLIISDLKVDITARNLTMIDFSGHKLEIDIAPGKHYLMEGQNSIGKSLFLKLIIGYSGGLHVEGKISYPADLNKSDITYVIQDDYVAIYKPILHRLSAPKLLSADKISGSTQEEDRYISDADFDSFVDFMSKVLFEMKYESNWLNVEDAKKSLLDNYNSYLKLSREGNEKAFYNTNEELDNLTGGQLKKLAIASAIYKKPKLLIFDESFNAIDEESKLNIYKIIEKYLPKSTVIVLQHQEASSLIDNKESLDDAQKNTILLNTALAEAEKGNNPIIIDSILKVLKTFDVEQENLSFYHEIITMERSQDENGIVKTSFAIKNLQDINENLVSFYKNEEQDEDIFSIENNICGENNWWQD